MDGRRDRVREVYDRIAPHFSQTRTYAWPDVEAFIEDTSPAGTALDIGCGNGRHAELLAASAGRVLGIDLSRGILRQARTRAAESGVEFGLIQGDATCLPFATDVIDIAVYVAALHHLPNRTARVTSLDELARVLRPGAPGLVSAWSTEHDRFDRTAGFDTTVDWTLPDGETVPRFYHIYDPVEFETDLARSALQVDRTWVAAGNTYATVTGPT